MKAVVKTSSYFSSINSAPRRNAQIYDALHCKMRSSYEVHKITTMSITNSILVANSMYAHCVMNFILCILQCANYSVASWIAVVLLGVANWHNNTLTLMRLL